MPQTETIEIYPKSEKAWRDPEVMERLFWESSLDTSQIAWRMECTPETVLRWAAKHWGIRDPRNLGTSYHASD